MSIPAAWSWGSTCLPLVTVYGGLMPRPFPFSLLASQFYFGMLWDL